MVVQFSVAGSHISAANTGVLVLLNPGPLVPPVTSTFPSGRSVALSCRRAKAIEATERQAGVDAFRSMTSAVLVGGSPPPMTKTLPSSYITDDVVVAVDVDAVIRHHCPGSGTGGVEVACNRAGSGIEYPAVWRQVHPRVQVQADLRIRQVTPGATSGLENFGKAIFTRLCCRYFPRPLAHPHLPAWLLWDTSAQRSCQERWSKDW